MFETLLIIVPRTLLGLMFLSAGADGFAYLLRGKEIFDPPLSAEGKDFLYNLKKNRLLWAAKATVDIIAALMLILNFHAPLGLLMLLPSIVVILIFQLTINKGGIPVAVLLAALTAANLGHYHSYYCPLLMIEDGNGPLSSGPYGQPAR